VRLRFSRRTCSPVCAISSPACAKPPRRAGDRQPLPGRRWVVVHRSSPRPWRREHRRSIRGDTAAGSSLPVCKAGQDDTAAKLAKLLVTEQKKKRCSFPATSTPCGDRATPDARPQIGVDSFLRTGQNPGHRARRARLREKHYHECCSSTRGRLAIDAPMMTRSPSCTPPEARRDLFVVDAIRPGLGQRREAFGEGFRSPGSCSPSWTRRARRAALSRGSHGKPIKFAG